MAIRKANRPVLNNKKDDVVKSKAREAIQPEAEEVDGIGVEEFIEDDDFVESEEDEFIEDDIVEETIEDEIEPEPIKPKQQKQQIKTKPNQVKKEKEKVKENKTNNGKRNLMQKVNTTNPYDIIEEGKVTKRDDLMKMAIFELEKNGNTMTLEGMNMVFKAIETAFTASLEQGAPVTFLGNQISVVNRLARTASVPNQDYDTLTFGHTAWTWRKLGDREVVRGKYDKDTKIFTDENGNTYDLSEINK